MSLVRRILFFGIILPKTKSLKFDDNEMFFEDKTLKDHLADYDILIYQTGTFRHEYTRSGAFGRVVLKPISPEAIRRENEVRLALEKGRTVCFIGSTVEDYVVSGILKAYRIHSSDILEGRVYRGLKIRRSEFKPFLDDVGATTQFYDEAAIDDIICSTDQGHVLGFSKRIERGLLLFLPCIWGSMEVDYITHHLKKLGRGLISYSARVIQEPPSYLSDFKFTNERVVRDKVDRIRKEEIAPLENKLKYYDKMKSILWLGDNDLVKAINEFMKSLGFETSVDEIYEEDLWILANGERTVIIEIKGKNGNLTRQDISKLDEHREARQVPDLTGLLIANTFMAANSLETKNQPFPPNVIKKAVNTNVVITRTIDLCKIYDRLEIGGIRISESLLKSIIGQKGWLTLQDDEVHISSP